MRRAPTPTCSRARLSNARGRRPASLALAAALLMALGAAAPARATLSRLPVKAQLQIEAAAAKAGTPVTGTLTIVAARPTFVGPLQLKGDGWTVARFEAPASTLVVPETPLVVPFTATASDPAQPLMLVYDVEGQPARASWKLSEQQIAASTAVRPLEPHTGPLPAELPAAAAALSRPEPALDPAGAGKPPTPQGTGATVARNITVTGQFLYERQDGEVLGVFGATVHVYDDDWPLDEELAVTTTDKDGDFSVTFSWNAQFLDDHPDIRVEFWSENAHVRVRGDGVTTLLGPYKWTTGTFNDVTGTSQSVGSVHPSNDDDMPALHILTNITRAWSYIDTYGGRNTPWLTVIYPTDQWPAYSPFFHEIYVAHDYDLDPDPADEDIWEVQWSEDVHIHEYGHHFINQFSTTVSPDYCNGNCDQQLEGWPWDIDCGHCLECSETDHDAWSEGWPNWLADVITRAYDVVYGVPAMNTRSQESPFVCEDTDGNACACDPLTTEGFLGMLLRDIEDDTQDDHNPLDNVTDVMNSGLPDIFTLAATDDVLTPQEFLDAYVARFPSRISLLWQTAKNVGYEIDSATPGGVSNLTSPSHPTTGDSPDATPTFTWTSATDDASGVDGYSVLVTTSSSAAPDQTQEINELPASYTHTALAPGSYFFKIRAVDRAGRWSSVVRSYGPFAIRPAAPANLEPDQPTGWSAPVVPRPVNDSHIFSVPAPTSLSGNANATYVNLYGVNSGEATTPVGFSVGVLLDGATAMSPLSSFAIEGGGGYLGVNMGPITVRGGRHTLGAFHDANEVVNETSETDNDWAGQWIWSPVTLSTNALVQRLSPPNSIGGWDAIPVGVSRLYNCDGLRFTSGGLFTAIVTWAVDVTEDYDIRSHPPSTSPVSGFSSGTVNAASTRPAGMIDAVLFNQAVEGNEVWDLGVLNHYSGTSSYSAIKTISSAFAYGESLAVTLAADRYLLLRHVDLAAGDLGPVSVRIDADPAGGRLHVGWLSPTFGSDGLDDVTAQASTGSDGNVRLSTTASVAGRYCAVVWRDPIDLPAGKAALANTFILEVERTPPDLIPAPLAGWYAPLVPRPAPDAVVNSAPAPTALVGFAPTWLNTTIRNSSPSGAATTLARHSVDGVLTTSLNTGGISSNSAVAWYSSFAPVLVLPGGRHTLSLQADQPNALEELLETNNRYGEQWSWLPPTIAYGGALARPAPPVRNGGWSEVTTGEALYFNCDGLRLAAPAIVGQNGFWSAVAVMPGAASDVDVRIHEVQSDAKSGFKSNLMTSLAGGIGEPDFVLVNFRNTAERAFDVGTLRDAADGVQGYTAHMASSTMLGVNPTGISTTVLDANHIVDLYEMRLSAGAWRFTLESGDSGVDWGFSLHPTSASYASRTTVVTGAAAWLAGVGQDESFEIEVPENGYYCLAVWKAKASALAIDARYKANFTLLYTGVEGPAPGRPAVTAMTSVHPNPFNPRTTIAFELATGGRTLVAIYNLRGERVRTLVDDVQAAGRHEAVWDGRDDTGAGVSSGVYVARLEAEGVRQARKLVLVQ